MNSIKIIPIFIIFVMTLTLPAFAHGGGIDANGGHHDYNNVSGLGTYHYHCDGYPAHLHTDGICPYVSSEPPTTYASQLAQKEPTASDFNSAGRKDTIYTVEKPPTIEKTEPTKTNDSIDWGDLFWKFVKGSIVCFFGCKALAIILYIFGAKNISHHVHEKSDFVGSILILGLTCWWFLIPMFIYKGIKKILSH